MNFLRFLPVVHLTGDLKNALILAVPLGAGVLGAIWLIFALLVANRLERANREAARQSDLLQEIGRTGAKISHLAESLDDIRAMLTKSPQLVVEHAKRQYGTVPFLEGESIIASDGAAALEYAENVLDRPFPKGEAAIAQEGKLACRYALRVLGRRFPLGEPAINRDPEAKRDYDEGLLKIDGHPIGSGR